MRSRRAKLPPRLTALAVLVGLALLAPASARAEVTFAGVVRNYVDPSQETALSFGDRSHWLQPWRGYLDTWPATRMLDSIGMNFNVAATDAPATARLLAASGFKRARIAEPWGMLDYDNPRVLSNDSDFRATLAALRDNGLRPLILLEAPHYMPCPMRAVSIGTDSAAAKGDTRIHLDAATAGTVVPGRTGLDSGPGIFGEIKRASLILTAVDGGGWATLSKPLPSALPAGSHPGSTLAYRPFAHPFLADGTSPNPDFESTLAGWLAYVKTVTNEAKAVIGSDDFDVEIWNELAYASDFLDVNSYYGAPADSGTGSTTDAILARTVGFLRDPANGVPNVGVGDGFANQDPRPSGATVPPGLTAIDKHPYPYSGMRRFPGSAQVDSTRPLDAQGNVDGPQDASGNWHESFTPTYDSFEPEYYLTATQKFQRYYKVLTIDLDNVIRDLSPITTQVGGVPHGRDLHPSGSSPPQLWVTEMNMNPAGAPSAGFTSGDRLHFETKVALRSLVAYAGKGTTAVDLFGVTDTALGLVPQSFFDQLHQTGRYPGDAAGGEVMDSVRRLAGAFAGAGPIAHHRSVSLSQIGDYAGNRQFDGDGTAAHPPLFDRDVLAFFPFQVTDSRFVVPVYVMTTSLGRNYHPDAPTSDPTRFDMPPETFRLTIGGVDGRGADVSATDPLTGANVALNVVGRSPETVVVDMPVTDSPRLLAIQEGPRASVRVPNAVAAPLLGKLRMRPSVFRAAGSGPSIARRPGAVVSFSLSRAATTRFWVERLTRHGHRRRFVRLRGHFGYRGRSGTNKFRFRGTLSRRPLAPGSYRLVAQATDPAGRKSARRQSRFRVRG